MKRKAAAFLFCLLLLLGALYVTVFAERMVASVNGTEYTTLQAAFDAAKLGITNAEKTVTLLCDIDLENTTVTLNEGSVILNLNGKTVTSAANKTLELSGGASLSITDSPVGSGMLLNTSKGSKDKGKVIFIADSESSLTVNEGTIKSSGNGAAIYCSEAFSVTLNGGSVDSIVQTDGSAAAYNGYQEKVVRYLLTIGSPALKNTRITGIAATPGLNHAYGSAVTDGSGRISVWLPDGIKSAQAKAGCIIYSGSIHAGNNTATLRESKVSHTFTDQWLSDGTQHWKVCSVCGVIDLRVSHAGGQATCETPAICEVCGQPYGEALGHNYAATFTIDTPATCLAAGSKSKHCSRCDSVMEVTAVPATGHSYAAQWSSDATGHWYAATCEHKSEISGFTGHTPEADDGDCTTEVKCTVCGYVITPAKEHVWSGWQSNGTQHWMACTNAGCSKKQSLGNHTGGKATCESPAICEVCGQPYGEALGHHYEDTFTVDAAPACLAPGSMSRHCTRCGAMTDVTVLPALGHTYSVTWSSNASGHWHDATCEHTGEVSGFAAHTPEADDGDCTTDVKCTACGYVTIPEKEHVWSGWQSDDTGHWKVCQNEGCTAETVREEHTGGKATCESPAICETCGQPYGGTLSHDFEDTFTTDAAPTCLVPGSMSRHCTLCGAKTDVTAIPATGHNWGEWAMTAITTCAQPGLETRICINDPAHVDTREISIDPNAHDWDGGVITAESTCQYPGVITYTCKNNAAHTYTEEIPMITGPHTHTITYAQPANGTLSVTAGGSLVASGTNVDCETVITISVEPNTGYELDTLKVNGQSVTSGSTYEVTENIIIQASVKIRTFVLNIDRYPNGIVYPAGIVTVNYGSSKTIISTPNAGYMVTRILLDGIAITPVTSYTFTNITSNHTMLVDFQRAYPITASAGQHGQISPSGTVPGACNGYTTFNITPDTGYQVSDVLVDGVSVGAVSSYLFENITQPHTIHTTFSVKTLDILTSPGSNGRISPINPTVNYDSRATFNIIPDDGYAISNVWVDGIGVGAVSSYTFNHVIEDHWIYANFIRCFTIASDSEIGGTISPSGLNLVNYNSSATYTITPADKYVISSVTVDGMDVGEVSSYTFSNVYADHTIHAAFDPLTTVTAGAGGGISPSGIIHIARGGTQTFHFTPDVGYIVDAIWINGVRINTSATSYTLTYSPATFGVTFRPDTFSITSSESSGGTIDPLGTSTLPRGESQTYVVTAETGYRVKSLLIDGTDIGIKNSYTFTNVIANHTIDAIFEPITFTVRTHLPDGGTITPPWDTQVPYGGSITYTITPETGMFIKDVIADGVRKGPVGTYTFENVRETHDIFAEFERYTYTVTAASMTNGTVLVPHEPLPAGDPVYILVKPDAGCRLKEGSLKYNGIGITGTSFFMPAENVTVTAEFEQYAFTVTAAPADHGTVTVPAGLVETGDTVNLTVTPDAGYRLKEGTLKYNGTAISGSTFTMPSENVAVTAVFEWIPVAYSISPSSFSMTVGFGTSHSFTSNGPFANFIGISFDSGSTYGVSATDTGSGISITVSALTFSNLAVGTHTLTLHFTTGYASVTITVDEDSGGLRT